MRRRSNSREGGAKSNMGGCQKAQRGQKHTSTQEYKECSLMEIVPFYLPLSPLCASLNCKLRAAKPQVILGSSVPQVCHLLYFPVPLLQALLSAGIREAGSVVLGTGGAHEDLSDTEADARVLAALLQVLEAISLCAAVLNTVCDKLPHFKNSLCTVSAGAATDNVEGAGACCAAVPALASSLGAFGNLKVPSFGVVCSLSAVQRSSTLLLSCLRRDLGLCPSTYYFLAAHCPCGCCCASGPAGRGELPAADCTACSGPYQGTWQQCNGTAVPAGPGTEA